MTHTYETVIGLEVHAELSTRTKVFCGCPTDFGAPPNTQTCPVCLGLPGSLPVLNRAALDLALRAALALECEIAPRTKFDRKNYFYPDSPKGYQISQYDLPLAQHGHLEIEMPAGPKRIGITRVHMEEDAGKLLHEGRGGQIGAAAASLVDFNRTGTPLIEIVSEPDLRSAEEAYAYLTAVKEVLSFAGVSDCKMEEGSLRCDANISVRPQGQAALGTKVELKNMNSFKNVREALDYEAKRQARVLTEGGTIVQETRLWDAEQGSSHPMRGKEEAHDYRYFPEPDLPELVILPGLLAEVKKTVPELPRARRARFQTQYGLSAYDAGVLTAEKDRADFFEDAVKSTTKATPKTIASFLTVDLLGKLNADGIDIPRSPIDPEKLAQVSAYADSGQISSTMAKQIMVIIYQEKDKTPEQVIKEKGFVQNSDVSSLEKHVAEVLAAHPGPVADFRAGKAQALGFLVGQVMKASGGKANPKLVNEILKKKLS